MPRHSSQFSDFQLLDKGGETVLLSIEGHGENLERSIRSSSRQREEDKIMWQVGKSYKEMRNEKEAPPRNVVKDRLKNFEISNDKNQPSQTSNKIHKPTTPTPFQWDDNGKNRLKKSEEYSYTSEEEADLELSLSGYKKLEHKRSVKDLLSDFEKKSKALQEEEKEHRGVVSLLQSETRDGGQRKVCSDTETLHFATSSSEEDEFDTKLTNTKHNGPPAEAAQTKQEESFPPPPPPADLEVGGREKPVTEETYLAMTPVRLTSSSLLSPHTSRTSLASSHGSLQSITSQTLHRFTPDKNNTSDATETHNRTPSQTLVMEHFRPEISSGNQLIEEETYVDMNEDGTQIQTPRLRMKEPILAKQCRERESNLDRTLTYDPPESPRYCEIDERTEQAHYELLSDARSAAPQHYSEVVYQEISENVTASTPTRKNKPPPLRPIEGLPDILGNAPTNKGNSSSDADDESSKDFDAIETKNRASITLDDSFRPASFYLSRCKTSSNDCDDDSSDSDLVSPPPVPSSPPPMEEVLGFASPSNFESSNYAEGLNNVLAAARSSSALRERSRRDSYDEPQRRPSVGSQQSLNKLHGSAQSLSSRELPPVPGPTNLQGSQQSLASKEIQQIGSRSSHQSQENIFRNSPYHSREGSLDNEAFLFHKFTQGTTITDYYKRQGSDSADLSSSDTANYEQEYRRYHLENIQEVSNTLERSESHHNTSIISQELNISYSSVYDARLGQGKEQKTESEKEPGKFYQPEPLAKEVEEETLTRAQQVVSPRSKIPYYMSDIMEDGTVVTRPNTDGPSLGVVDAITKSMNALDVESKSYFEDKNQRENERIKLLRRSYTPDPYLAKAPVKDPIESEVTESNNVARSKSLEGLLGDSQGGPKDNIGYAKQTIVQRDQPPPSQGPRPPSANSRRGPPPPPPAGVPPLELSDKLVRDGRGEDEVWADSLRRASMMQQRAKSSDSLPPPTAPKPKTPVPTLHHPAQQSQNSHIRSPSTQNMEMRQNTMDLRSPLHNVEMRQNTMDLRSPPHNVEMRQHTMDLRSPPQNLEMRQNTMDLRSPPQNLEMRQNTMNLISPPHTVEMRQNNMDLRSPPHNLEMRQNNMDLRSTPHNLEMRQKNMDLRSPPHHLEMRQNMDLRSPDHNVEMRQNNMDLRSPGHNLEMRQNSARSPPYNVEMRQNNIDSRNQIQSYNNPEMRQHSTQMRQNTHNMRQNAGYMGQNTPDMRQNAGYMGRTFQDMRKNPGYNAQNTPNMRQNSEYMGQNAGYMGQNYQDMRKNAGQNPPDMRQNSGYMGQNNPSMIPNGNMRHHTGYTKSPGHVNMSHDSQFSVERQDVGPAGFHYSQHHSQPPPVIQRNTVVSRNDNFLDSSLPSPTCDANQRRSVSRPSSRGADMGRQTSRDSLTAKSMTLPAKIRISQEPQQDSDSDNSPRSRTSKSGLHEDSCPVPPSPSPAQHNIVDNNFSNESIDWSHPNSRGITSRDISIGRGCDHT